MKPLTIPSVAVISVLPDVTVVANPREPDALLTVATASTEELQVTKVVKLCTLLSE